MISYLKEQIEISKNYNFLNEYNTKEERISNRKKSLNDISNAMRNKSEKIIIHKSKKPIKAAIKKDALNRGANKIDLLRLKLRRKRLEENEKYENGKKIIKNIETKNYKIKDYKNPSQKDIKKDKNGKVYCTELINECFNGIFYNQYSNIIGKNVLIPDELSKSILLDNIFEIKK